MFILRFVVAPIIAILGAIFVGLIIMGIDRILAARMQSRVGPPLRQPFWDVKKLMIKENIIPENAISWLFNAAPVICLAVVSTILLYLPLAGFSPILAAHGDLIVVVYLLILPALAKVIGGFASGSPFASVGAQREMVMMMSYEFPLAIIAVSVAWLLSKVHPSLDAFSLQAIATHPVWGLVKGPLGIVGLILLLVSLLVVTPGELSVIPFDLPDAPTEIVGGVLAEYSGRNYALFYLASAVKLVVLPSLLIAIFFPYGISGLFNVGAAAAGVIDVVFFLVKLFVILFFSVTCVHVLAARLKIDQLVNTYFMAMTAVSLVGLVLIVLDAAI
ncbi:MAG: formate hydrogenlyase subunit 4 [candidate division Zixibacteria bacterium 4484_95]|nr:MAG: formate hydrogenlyase subunit 4 [candidate division Zixibacteria bacterium 4484_95]RLB92631.1 MAG: NADH-quinone oxidoreductase subunit H [Deltaproteobacteria bacterium]